MRKSLRRSVLGVASAVVILFVIFMVNQVAQLVALADRVSPTLGTITLWVLSGLILFSLLVPVYLLIRLPRSLIPPSSETDPRFPDYLETLKARLRRNHRLRGVTIETRDDVEAALARLGEEADGVTQQTALRLFVSTAVLQNGSLDALAVLVAQSKMVYEIASIYYQRPSLSQLVRVYANVATSSFLARQLDDIDLAEYIQPVISAAFTSAVGTAVTGTGFGSVVTNSLLSGSANAYLTLRVGVITKRYCGSLITPPRSVVARSAVLEAAKMIPSVAKEASKQVVGAFTRAMGGSFVKGLAGTVKSAGEVTKGLGQAATALWGKRRKRGEPDDIDPQPDEVV